MKLYPRQLHSLEELKREKHVLRYAVKHTDEWLSLNELKGSKAKTEDAAEAGILGTVISALGSKSLLNTLLAIAPPVITLLSKRTGGKKKNPVESLAKNVLFGYAKWKMVQMAYKIVLHFMGSKKENPKKEQQ